MNEFEGVNPFCTETFRGGGVVLFSPIWAHTNEKQNRKKIKIYK